MLLLTMLLSINRQTIGVVAISPIYSFFWWHKIVRFAEYIASQIEVYPKREGMLSAIPTRSELGRTAILLLIFPQKKQENLQSNWRIRRERKQRIRNSTFCLFGFVLKITEKKIIDKKPLASKKRRTQIYDKNGRISLIKSNSIQYTH